MSRWLSRIGTSALLALLRAYSKLPYPVVRDTGSAVGSVLYRLVAPRRRIARINLRLCMPELDRHAREAIVREIRDGTPLQQAIRIADEEIIRASKKRQDALPMGTTVVAARVSGDRFEVAWVGDSRVYLWRDGKLAQLSQDHSYVQELISQGAISLDQARSHPHRNVVTQALGVTDPQALNVETMSGTLAPGMQLLLCSDGLNDLVDDETIRTLLLDSATAEQACRVLVDRALAAGGRDNVTVVVASYRWDEQPSQS